MRIATLAVMSLGLPAAVECFSIGDFLVKTVREKTKIEIFEDVGLPTDTENFPTGARASYLASISPKANKDFLRTIGVGTFIEEKLLDSGEKKPLGLNPPKRSENWRAIHARLINEIIKAQLNAPDPVEGYLYFGNRDFKTVLPMLCQVNPFFASALTLSEKKDYFELISYSPEPEKDNDGKYLKIVRELTDPSHRINCKFNLDMTIAEITRFDESGNAEIVPEAEWDYYSSGILFNLGYYSSCVHATIHILHYLMCGAIRECTLHDSSLASWANPYDDNVAIKHLEVALALYDSSIGGRETPNADGKLLTGKDGFGGTNAIKPKMRDILCLWGSFKNAEDFATQFLLGDIYKGAEKAEVSEINSIMEEAGILSEFNKHLALVQPFADELTEAMEKSDEKAFAKTEKKLSKFMRSCGKNVSKIDTISSWVQLMACTGLYHGSTLSYTRLMGVPEVAMWRNINEENWDKSDTELISIGFNTIQGMTEGRHVFMSGDGDDFKWDTTKMDGYLLKVLKKYDDMAQDLKTEYEKQIEARDDLREYGWILSDYCNDGYDGKQHTITTYI